MVERKLALISEVEDKQVHLEKLDELIQNYVGEIAPWYAKSNQEAKTISNKDLVAQWEKVYGKLDSPEVKAELARMEAVSKTLKNSPGDGIRYI